MRSEHQAGSFEKDRGVRCPRSYRRLIVVVTLTLGFSGGLSIGAVERAAAGAWRTHTWNLAMGNDGTDVLWQEKRDIAAFMVSTNTPWVAAFTEMCRDQFDSLKATLDPLGYKVVGFWPWSGNATQCHGTKIGTAVFALAVEPADVELKTLKKHSLSPPTGQDFAMVCKVAVSIGFSYFACATHMAPSRATASAQAADAFSWWSTNWLAYKPIVGGDFNHRHPPESYYNSDGLQQFWFIGEEMHLITQKITHRRDDGTLEKIDFSFAAPRSMFGRGAVQDCTQLSNSDHRYCIGNFTV